MPSRRKTRSSSKSSSKTTTGRSGRKTRLSSTRTRAARKTGSRVHTSTVRKSPRRSRASRSNTVGDITYVFECTSQGCGYRIVRDEKAEPGQLRFDIKCPKCHNEEFRCLGKGDLPDNFASSVTEVPLSPIDYATVDNRVGIGSS